MSDVSVLNVKINAKLKKEAQALAKEIGLPVSVVVSAGLREFVRTRRLTLSADTEVSDSVERELLVLSDKVRNGEDFSPDFYSAEAALDWLHGDDN
jgi:antitoxin component of RelBE/YafQ-DinJ toxin-antitoxin module